MSTRVCESCGQEVRIGDWPYCNHGQPSGTGTNLSAIHSSERTVVYRNPRTGEVRYPARADQPVPEVYARQGYRREELATPQAVRSFEKETGRIHERSHYDPGSPTAERELNRSVTPERPQVDRALHNKLVDALR